MSCSPIAGVHAERGEAVACSTSSGRIRKVAPNPQRESVGDLERGSGGAWLEGDGERLRLFGGEIERLMRDFHALRADHDFVMAGGELEVERRGADEAGIHENLGVIGNRAKRKGRGACSGLREEKLAIGGSGLFGRERLGGGGCFRLAGRGGGIGGAGIGDFHIGNFNFGAGGGGGGIADETAIFCGGLGVSCGGEEDSEGRESEKAKNGGAHEVSFVRGDEVIIAR